MKRIVLTLIVLIVSSSTALVQAGDWEFNILGINPTHFKGRCLTTIVFGGLASLIVHEAGHVLYADRHDGGHYDYSERIVWMDDYYNRTHYEQQMFHRAGFLAQLIVGGTLTAIPYTRHKDFTLGFNSYTSINTAVYAITGGLGKSGEEDRSDIHQLDNGRTEGAIYTASAGILSYINLKKPVDIETE